MVDLAILIGLIMINGLFALAELAILSARSTRLQELADQGSKQAKTALELLEAPGRFLATVQVGITLVGVVAGVFGGAVLAEDLTSPVASLLAVNTETAYQLSLTAIVGLTTYLSLVIGELVPKRIALSNPERLAMLVAVPMKYIAIVASPLVSLLDASSAVLVRLFGVRSDDTARQLITDYEVISLIQSGTETGQFEISEQEMVKGALELDDIRIQHILTPRTRIDWLDINASPEDIKQILRDAPHAVYPVCENDIDDVIGVVYSTDIIREIVQEHEIDLRSLLQEALFVPETVNALNLLSRLKETRSTMALVLGEYGGIEGLVTIQDIIEEIIGVTELNTAQYNIRDDGSILIDGAYPIDGMEEILEELEIPEDEKNDYSTVAGFVLHRLGKIPETGNSFTWGTYRIEVVDMDSNRVDKVLIMKLNGS